ncbi:MAG: flagellar hook-associated protein FlgK [Bacillota bacterium]|nr:MAG: flagellar hook-associated protein FlgK [Bacillota bacterium]
MRSTFFGLEIARRGLWAQQRALDVTGHNIANANTEGYSRQVARLVATPAYAPPSRVTPMVAGQVGTGVQVADITRARDIFLDRQVRELRSHLGRWEVRSRTLAELETIVGEPSDSGLSATLNQFWEALGVLANQPSSIPARTAVIEQAQALLERFQVIDRQLEDLQRNLDASVVARVQRVNEIVARLAEVHKQVRVATAAGQNPNDLLDERDRLLEELATLLPVRVTEYPDGTVKAEVAGLTLVDGDTVHILKAQPPSGQAFVEVYWDDGSGGTVPLDVKDLGGGELAGLLESRDDLVGTLRGELQQLFFALAKAINRIHQQGYDLHGQPGEEFFVGITSPADLQAAQVNPNLVDDPAKLAAATQQGPIANGAPTGAPGDGSNALAMAALRNTPLPLLGGVTASAYLESIVARLGIEGRQAQEGERTTQLLLDQVGIQRESVRGVSLDEEMTNLVRFQHAYAAAARLVTAVDEMLNLLIERTGLVGR